MTSELDWACLHQRYLLVYISNENKYYSSKKAIPNRLDNFYCDLAILFAYIETQNPEGTMDCSGPVAGCLWIVA